MIGAGPRRTGLATCIVVAVMALSAIMAGARGQGGDVAAKAAAEAYLQSKIFAAEGRLDDALRSGAEALSQAERAFGTEHPNVASILTNQAMLLRQQRRLAEARLAAERAAAIIDKAGPANRDAAVIYSNLGTIQADLGEYDEAQPRQRKALDILIAVKASAEEQTIASRNLAITLRELGRNIESAALFKDVADARGRSSGAESVPYGMALVELAGAQLTLGSLEAAQDTAQRAAAVLKSRSGAAEQARADLALARIAIERGRFREALSTLDAASVKAGPQVPDILGSIAYQRGHIRILRGEFIEAKSAFEAALLQYRRLLGENHPTVAKTLMGIALSAYGLGRFEESRQVFDRALQAQTKATPATPWMAAPIRTEFGGMLVDMGDARAGETEIRRSLADLAKAEGDWRLLRGYANSALGSALLSQERPGEAQPVFEQAIRLIEETRGPQSPDLPPGLLRLASIKLAQGRPAEARALAARAVSIRRTNGALSPWGLAQSLAVLSDAELAHGNGDAALKNAAEAIAVVADRLLGGTNRADLLRGEALRERAIFESYLNAAYAQYAAGKPALIADLVRVAQFPHLTDTASAVARMSARLSQEFGSSAQLLREREEAIKTLNALDLAFTSSVTSGAASAPSQDNRRQAEELAGKLRSLEAQIRAEMPRSAALLETAALPLADIQRALEPGEGLLVQVTSKAATFVLFVSPTEARAVRAEIGAKALEDLVARLRAGLDLTGNSMAALAPFDVEAAYVLYRMLFAPFESELTPLRHLFVVSDGAMQNITPGVLLTKPAPLAKEAYGQFRDQRAESFAPFKALSFLGWERAFSILPNVSALVALRQLGETGPAPEPFIGFGDPSYESPAGRSRGDLIQDIFARGRTLQPRELRGLFSPLPQTRTELESIATALGASPTSLHLGANMTEARVRGANLGRFRVVAFATHGLTTKDFGGRLAEPALVMSPPAAPHGLDDLLLKASTIASLEMNAEWVLLSACSTAASSGKAGAEGLSGLAQAFFLAGSKALLVSHWPVDSTASQRLSVGTIEAWAGPSRAKKAEALRLAMQAFGKDAKPEEQYYAHPFFWAPFVVVGEGGR